MKVWDEKWASQWNEIFKFEKTGNICSVDVFSFISFINCKFDNNSFQRAILPKTSIELL